MVAILRFFIVVSAVLALFAVMFGAETSKASDYDDSSDFGLAAEETKLVAIVNNRARCVGRSRLG